MSDERRILTVDRKCLLKAADYIEQYGHAIGSYRIHDHPEKMPRVCLLGALRMATDDGGVLRDASILLESAIGTQHIALWNDAATAVQAVAALRRAALGPHYIHDQTKQTGERS